MIVKSVTQHHKNIQQLAKTLKKSHSATLEQYQIRCCFPVNTLPSP